MRISSIIQCVGFQNKMTLTSEKIIIFYLNKSFGITSYNFKKLKVSGLQKVASGRPRQG